MSKIFGISGAQGAGKSTLLNELETKYGYRVDKFKVSRAVQKQLGWETLDRVMDNPTSMMAFQEEVLNQKNIRDLELKGGSDEIVLTERTFADIFAYAKSWATKFKTLDQMTRHEHDDFVRTFFKKAYEAQHTIYAGTILLPYMSHMVWEEDPNRASLSDVNSVYWDAYYLADQVAISSSRHNFVITEETVEARAKQVHEYLSIQRRK